MNTQFKKNWPFYWISRVDARYVQILDKRLKPMGIDVPRWRVLMSLYEDTYLSISEIADFSTMRLNTTTKVVQRMIGDGQVTTRVRPTDARVTEACLTEEGDRLRALALKEARDIFEQSFSNVSDDEMAALNAILEKVFHKLNQL
ncbi:DNA-binding MarR family transcriptional regulator [Agrobacterium vitis]|nr:DNA-binding MarR family transcriptional regulator [Agrobacterium vitis]MBE1436534.1 DNA-binding MarR family transcriptional regulator [Agrobacterium vitis]